MKNARGVGIAAMVLSMLSLLLVAFWWSKPDDFSVVGEAVAGRKVQLTEASERGDAAAIAALYAEDAQVLPPNDTIARGRAEIETVWQGLFDLGLTRIELVTREMTIGGSTATEIGTYNSLGPGGMELDRGKYVLVWKKQGDAWSVYYDIWNSSVPFGD